MQSVSLLQGHHTATAQTAVVTLCTVTKQNTYKAAYLIAGAQHKQVKMTFF